MLCHGFPELAFSWRHQLPALARAGFWAIAPDQRGYGRSDKPAAVEEYDRIDSVEKFPMPLVDLQQLANGHVGNRPLHDPAHQAIQEEPVALSDAAQCYDLQQAVNGGPGVPSCFSRFFDFFRSWPSSAALTLATYESGGAGKLGRCSALSASRTASVMSRFKSAMSIVTAGMIICCRSSAEPCW